MVEKSLISPKSKPESVGTSKFQSVFPAPKQSIENTGPMRSKDVTPSSHLDEPKVGPSICDYFTCALLNITLVYYLSRQIPALLSRTSFHPTVVKTRQR